MFTKRLSHVRKLLYGLLLLGSVISLVGIGFPANAATDRLQGMSIAAVVNDDFDNALIMTTGSYSNTQDIITATTAVDDPNFTCTGSQKYNTVWYRYTPSVSDTLVFSTAGSQTGMVIAVWTGARGSLINQACATSKVQLAVNAGTTYHIEIARNADQIIPAPTTMNLVFSVYPASTPPDPFSKSAPVNDAAYRASSVTLSWESSTYADNYAYCYDTTNNDICDTSWIATSSTSASLSGLSLDTGYFWQVRAVNTAATTDADDGMWWSFTTVNPADLNHWAVTVSSTSKAMSFDVLTDGTLWLNFKVSIYYKACDSSTKTTTIVTGGPGTITQGGFSYKSGGFSFSGTFNSPTTASGSYNLSNYAVCDWIASPGYCCWAFNSGSGSWKASGPPLPMKQVFLPLLLKHNTP